jgi:glycosyltransferase involved in cell wall biosynthesis
MEARRILDIAEDEEILLCLGSRLRNKDQVTAVRAVGLMSPRAKLRLIIVGKSGDADDDLHASIAAAGNRVSIWDHRDDADVLIAAADALVMPSLREGLPMAIVESMLAGTPVIATPVGAVPELLTHGESALFFPPGDAATLRIQIERLLESSAFAAAVAQRARHIALSHLTLQKMGAAYAEIVRRLV